MIIAILETEIPILEIYSAIKNQRRQSVPVVRVFPTWRQHRRAS